MNIKKAFALLAALALLSPLALLPSCSFSLTPSEKADTDDKLPLTPPQVWTVTFDDQGADIPANPTTAAVTEPDTTAALPSEPGKKGYFFDSWYTEPEGQGELFTETTKVEADITVYANWIAEPQDISLDGINGTVTVSAMTGSSATFTFTPKTPVSSAKIYASLGNSSGLAAAGENLTELDGVWTVTVTSETYTAGAVIRFDILTIQNGAEVSIPQGSLGDMTSWASFTYSPNYAWNVTFDSLDADIHASPATRTVRSPALVLSVFPSAPVKNGYDFLGWYTAPRGEGTLFNETTPVTADLTVYAFYLAQENENIFGPNVLIFSNDMTDREIQARLDQVYATQRTAEFGSERYALLFKPGAYNVQVNTAFYMQVLGLGRSPDDTLINGSIQSDGAAEATGNHHVTQNFWRSMENIAIQPTEYGRNMWAVSQAAPARRIHVKGDLWLFDINPNNGESGWASGGFLADSLVDGAVLPGGQQQWLYRNSDWGTAEGGVWNMVFAGCGNTPEPSFGAIPNYTVIDTVPVIREKPYLYVDADDQWQVFMGKLTSNASGTTWTKGPSEGVSKPLSDFYIAKSSTDTAATINAALASGRDLLFTPGIYDLDDTIRITRANTVVLGLGLATLRANGGVTAIETADIDGITIAGLLIEAGTTSSDCLMQIGPADSSGSHSANPTLLADVFFRVGGAAVGRAKLCLEINSNDVIGDNLWIWRADHGIDTSTWGWTVNEADTGLVVNGDNVTIYALAVEHFQKYQTLWNGNGGRVYFYQSEIPYDVPDQQSWMNGDVKGYASYKVADTVTDHHAWGVGVYCFFNVNPALQLENAIEVPASGTEGAMFRNMVTVALGDGNVGQINHVINGKGAAVTSASNPTYLER